VTTDQAHAIATLMGRLTQQIFEHYYSAELPNFTLANTTLQTRVGSGKATYCRKHQNSYSITYGLGMILDKRDANLCSGWLTSREIAARGYFDGQISYLNLLSHTVCHEFAHILQFECDRAGTRRNAKVHNALFYRLLDEIYHHGYGNTVSETLAEHTRLYQLPMTFNTGQEFAITSAQQYKRGSQVQFEHAGIGYQGLIKRCNKLTFTIAVPKGLGIQEWRVPHHAVSSATN
jgi:hypothetical protein